jgi:hypothetical protein
MRHLQFVAPFILAARGEQPIKIAVAGRSCPAVPREVR